MVSLFTGSNLKVSFEKLFVYLRSSPTKSFLSFLLSDYNCKDDMMFFEEADYKNEILSKIYY